MPAPAAPKPTFNFKVIGITVLVCAAAFAAYLISARFLYQSNVAAEQAEINSGESPLERKKYPTGYAEERPFEQVQQQQQPPVQQQQPQQTQRQSTQHREPPPPPKPMNFYVGKADKQDTTAKSTPASAAAPAAEPPPDRPEYARQGLDDQKDRFAARAGRGKAYVEDVLHEPLSPLMVRRGWLIPAVRTNAPSTAMPGDMFAMVTMDVKDSLTGHCVLIPAGSIISGETNDTVAYGEEVAQGAWTGMSIAGTGQWIDLGSMPGTNLEGRPGMPGKVNHHRGTMALALLGSVAVKLLGQAGQLMDSGGNEVTVYSAGGNAAASSVADPLNEIVTRELNRENVIDMDIGEDSTFMVNRDLYLPAQGDCNDA